MSIQFKNTSLYGGAISVDLPATFFDASNIRQIPDHQEVYLNEDGYANIVCEITERVTGFTTDAEALHYHLEDIADGNDGIRVWSEESVTIPKLPNATPAYTMFATSHPVHPSSTKGSTAFTGILMIMIRLVPQSSDIIINVNIPHRAGEYDPKLIDIKNGRAGPMLDTASIVCQRIVETFVINNYSLFGQ